MNSVFVVLMFIAASVVADSRRTKRILAGSWLWDKEVAPYKVVEYLVWVGRTYECYEEIPWWRVFFSFGIVPCGSEKPRRGRFAGALITPTIVQTSCTQLVTFQFKANVRFQRWGTAVVNTNFEDKVHVYMGGYDVLTFKYPVESKKFVVHYNCGKLGRKGAEYVRYDIGWIYLDDDIPGSTGVSTGEWGTLDYPGPYMQKQLDEAHDKAISEMQVCLVVGWGYQNFRWEIKKGHQEGTDLTTPMSRYLTYGWIQVMDYYECYLVAYQLLHMAPYDFSYNDSVSWMCSDYLKQFGVGALHYLGDYGSPITCNNIYLAVASGLHKQFPDVHGFWGFIQLDTALKYVPESTVVDYMVEFQRQITEDNQLSPNFGSGTIVLNPYDRKYFHKRLAHVSYVKRASSANTVKPATSSGNTVKSGSAIPLLVILIVNQS